VIFLCRNHEEAMKAIVLPSIQQLKRIWIRAAAARHAIGSLALEED
jgi:hypothetical protein